MNDSLYESLRLLEYYGEHIAWGIYREEYVGKGI
jgi:hypothetical protein